MITITIKEVFERVYGPLPEEARVYIGYRYTGGGTHMDPTVQDKDGAIFIWRNVWMEVTHAKVVGDDLSDRPAYHYRGFFGQAFNNVIAWEGIRDQMQSRELTIDLGKLREVRKAMAKYGEDPETFFSKQ